MRFFRLFLLALAMAVLASPAPAQSITNDLPRRSGGGDVVHYGGRGGDYGGGRGMSTADAAPSGFCRGC